MNVLKKIALGCSLLMIPGLTSVSASPSFPKSEGSFFNGGMFEDKYSYKNHQESQDLDVDNKGCTVIVDEAFEVDFKAKTIFLVGYNNEVKRFSELSEAGKNKLKDIFKQATSQKLISTSCPKPFAPKI